ncbi:hypothetical protein OG943_20225 [Amycolatopsis sp. NBC_00345]|uniref:hypothetical protein n=1 Tax=Amycolatopsis sp. NBC_00345 TaxID=2975955 RepID=UPI002E27620C
MTDQETRGLSTADLASTAQGTGTRADTGEPHQFRVDTEGSVDIVDTEEPAETAGAHTADQRADSDNAPPLFDEDAVTSFRGRWQNVQTGFVDDPRRAVRDADELVAAVISALASSFAEHKGDLEAQWQQGEPATEELRIALRRYRSFFDQLIGS